MLDISEQKIDIECPECKTPNTVTMRQVADEAEVPCAGCSKVIALTDKDGSAKKSVESVNDALKELGDTLKNFGK